MSAGGREEEGCPTHLLTDEPSAEDLLGSHQRLATLIADTVGSDPGGKAIALTGNYGSGKSTVVRLLKSSVEHRKPQIGVVIFDSWAHKSDPLRRSFLEALMAGLRELGWLSKDQTQPYQDQLARKTEESTVINEPLLTTTGRLLALVSLLVPIGYLILAQSWSDKTRLPRTLGGVPSSLVGLLLSIAPVVVAIVAYFVWRPHWQFWRRSFWMSHRGSHQGDSILAFFVHKQRETIHTTSWRTPDPTTVEFRAIYEELVRTALEHPDRRLVIVIDNLDRLPSDQAQDVWATMRTFVDFSSSAMGWHDKIWLIVPVDSSHLGAIWPQFGENDPQPVFDKTFQLALTVAPPILSDWRGFLIKELHRAFPAHEPPADLEQIYRLYRSHQSPDDRPVNPREIKLFINRLVLLHRQWQHAIPLPMVAAFELRRRDIGIPSRSLTRADFLSPAEHSVLQDPQWAQKFAALYFNVPLENALQVLIGTSLATVLTQGDDERVAELSATHGFEAVCEQVVDDSHESWRQPGGEPLIRATAALRRLTQRGYLLNHSLGLLLNDCRNHRPWRVDEVLAQEIIDIVDDLVPETDRRPLFLNFVSNIAPPTEAGGSASPASLTAWARGYVRLLTVAPVLLEEADLVALGVRGDVAAYLEVVTHAGESVDEGIYRYCRPLDIAPANVVAALAERVGNKQFTFDETAAIALLLKTPVQWPWAALLAAVGTRLGDFAGATPIEAPVLSAALVLALSGVKEAEDRLQRLADDGALLHQMYLAQAANDAAAVGLAVLASVVYLPSGELTTVSGQAANGQTQYKQFLTNPSGAAAAIQAVRAYFVPPALVARLLDAGLAHPATRGLVAEAIAAIVGAASAADLEGLLSVQRIVDIDRVLPRAVVEALLRKWLPDRLYAALESAGFKAELSRFYRQAFLIHPPTESMMEMTVDALREVQQQDWVNELRQPQALVPLALTIQSQGTAVGLGQPFQDALLDVVKAALLGEQLPVPPGEGWNAYFGLLEPMADRTLMRDIRDELIARSDGNLSAALQVAGDALLKSDTMNERADEVVRRVGSSLLAGADQAGLAWLEGALSPAQGLLRAVPEETRASFRDRVIAAREGQEPDTPASVVLVRIEELALDAAPLPSRAEVEEEDHQESEPKDAEREADL